MKLIRKLTGSNFLSMLKFLIKVCSKLFRFGSFEFSKYFYLNYFLFASALFFFELFDDYFDYEDDGTNLTRLVARCAFSTYIV